VVVVVVVVVVMMMMMCVHARLLNQRFASFRTATTSRAPSASSSSATNAGQTTGRLLVQGSACVENWDVCSGWAMIMTRGAGELWLQAEATTGTRWALRLLCWLRALRL
jgi:hypothetical protein